MKEKSACVPVLSHDHEGFLSENKYDYQYLKYEKEEDVRKYLRIK